ncbi:MULTISPECIES: MarR family winged helix-turn-helix transcriptional regulator [Protofrankia]|uniref:MarR family transcriptional regulator n=1 Tax=Protofrankia coriariae TaxID=1562887 RepID=A0ABR5EYK9_9ACTN|nr:MULTISPECIES: MarR family transcriptional regulator [Protofrankia]KLL09523.1 MarR family transcriptional regulator [Protofrankia coriariae]ONH31368.1 MarR family transcriptional regulator [Protofrankia sp. BMG5.30]
MSGTPDASTPPGAPDDGVDELTDAVLTASRLLVAVSARSLTAVGEDVTLPQFRMLVVLASRGPLRAGDLADFLAVHPSTATRMADRLVAAGLIDRLGNPDNRREVNVALTVTGRQLVEDVTRRRRAEITAIVARMDPRLRGSLVAALRAFAAAGGEPGVDANALGWS